MVKQVVRRQTVACAAAGAGGAILDVVRVEHVAVLFRGRQRLVQRHAGFADQRTKAGHEWAAIVAEDGAQFGIRFQAADAGEMLEERPRRGISSGTATRRLPGRLLGLVFGDQIFAFDRLAVLVGDLDMLVVKDDEVACRL
jgi:hypothetical protein